MRKNLKTALLTGAALAAMMFGAAAQADERANTITFDMPAQSLDASLRALGALADRQILFSTDAVSGRQARAIHGDYSAEEALRQLLDGSGLSYEATPSGVIMVKSQRTAVRRGGTTRTIDSSSVNTDLSRPIQTATAAQDAPVPASRTDISGARIEEVIVTAQKREERLQDVPVPVTAITADTLLNSNQLRLQDYYSRIPGFSVAPGIQATQILSIRGVTTGGGNPTVGVVIDDVPYGASTALGSGLAVPDLDPSDLVRVEVLRGPQGTLYGASSMGGLLKFVTVDPSTERVSGRIQAGVNGVYNGDEIGHSLRGAVNVPIDDEIAIRVSAFTRRDPGYIDDPSRGADGVNRIAADGGRLSALWKSAASPFSVKVSALLQRTKGDAVGDIFPSLGDLKQRYLANTGKYDIKNQAYSAVVNGEIGDVALTSVTGYNVNSIYDSLDYTAALGAITPAQFGPGVTGVPYNENSKTKKFTQEVRLTTSFGERFDWLLGGFFTDESNAREQRIYAVNPNTGLIAGQWINLQFPTTYQEIAAFSDVTVHFTDQFDIQVGGRVSENKQTYSAIRVGPFVTVVQGLASPLIIPLRRSKANATTYLVTPRFKVTEDLMLYARLASGYRAGGPNSTAGVRPQYDPDKTRNYEVGAKGDLFEDTVSFDVSAYYIDWKNIQIDLRTAAGGYLDNGGAAKSQGVEISLEWRPLPGTTIAAWSVWNDAKLAEPLPATSIAYGAAGNRLPYSSRFTSNISADQDFDLGRDMVGFVGGAISIVGDRLGIFRGLSAGTPLPRQGYKGYTKIDLRAGLRYDDWTTSLYINNVADKRGALSGGLGAFNPLAFTYIQPRTVGLTASKNF